MPRSPLSSSIMRATVVRLMRIAMAKKTTGNTTPIEAMESASLCILDHPESAVRFMTYQDAPSILSIFFCCAAFSSSILSCAALSFCSSWAFCAWSCSFGTACDPAALRLFSASSVCFFSASSDALISSSSVFCASARTSSVRRSSAEGRILFSMRVCTSFT